MIAELILPIRNYEAVYIFNPNLTEEEQKNILRKNKEIIQQYKGTMNHLDTWGSRHLANPIGKFSRGTYFHMSFTAQSDCIKEIERTLKINDKVLRYYHNRLDDRKDIAKHMEDFKDRLVESRKRYEEREAKFKAKDGVRRQRRAVRA